MRQLNIKSDETYRMATELAGATGESLTVAVTRAIGERLARVAKPDPQTLVDEWLELTKNDAACWKEPWKSGDHGDLLYDELGLPK